MIAADEWSKAFGMFYMRRQQPHAQTDTIAVCQGQHSSNTGGGVVEKPPVLSIDWLLYMDYM